MVAAAVHGMLRLVVLAIDWSVVAGNGHRPFSVSVVFVIILISGVLGIIAGIYRLFNRGDDLGWISSAVTIGLGVIYLLVARGIANGNRGARFLVAVVSVLWIVAGVWAFIIEPAIWPASTVQVLLGLITLGLLYNGKARAFFGA